MGLLTPVLGQQDSLQQKIKVVAVHGLIQPENAAILKQLKGVEDTSKLRLRLSGVSERIVANGYAEFAIDRTQWCKDTLHISMHEGPKYFYRIVEFDGLDALSIRKAGFEKIQRKIFPFSQKDFENRMRVCLDEYQNNGFPFSAFRRISINYDQQAADTICVDLKYQFDPGSRVIIDTIEFVGNKREQDAFIASLIGIRSGDLYDQSIINKIRKS